MKNKLVKSMSMIIAIAMLISMVPAVVSAADFDVTIDTVTVKIGTVDEKTGSAQVTVTASGITGEMTDYTLLAVRNGEEISTVEGLADFDDDDLEGQIEYIDQDDAVLSEGKLIKTFTLRGANLAEMKTRTTSYGDVITVFIGGTGVKAERGFATYEAPKADAPTLSVDETAVWANGDVVISYAGDTAAAWEAKELIVKVDGNTVAVKVNDETELPYYQVDTANDNIIITGLAKGEYDVIEVTESTGEYKVATLGTAGTKLFEVKSRVAAAKAAGVFGGITVAYDTDENSGVEANQCWITVPALTVTTEEEPVVTITYTLPAVEGAITAIEDGAEGARIIKIARPEATATEALTVTITADIAAANESNDIATKTYTIKKIGDNGPAFTADDVQIVEQRRGVYNKTGMSLVIISNEVADFDVASERLVIENDGTQYPLYYNESCNRFVGIVPDYEGDDASAKKSAAKDQIKVVAYAVEETSADYEVHYGKADEDSVVVTSGRLYNTTDLVGIKKIMGRFDNRTDKMYLAADMGEGVMDGQINATDLIEIKLYLGRQLNELRINGGTLAQ